MFRYIIQYLQWFVKPFSKNSDSGIHKGYSMNKKTKNLVTAAMLAALTLALTAVIKLPSPLGGYINLGDAAVLLSAWMLSPVYGALSAGIGSALADILSGYAMYAPATFVIKATMAVMAYFIFKALKEHPLGGKLLGGIAAELIMIGGYFVFEGFIYGFGASLVNVPPNTVQAIAGIAVGILLSGIVKKALEK